MLVGILVGARTLSQEGRFLVNQLLGVYDAGATTGKRLSPGTGFQGTRGVDCHRRLRRVRSVALYTRGEKTPTSQTARETCSVPYTRNYQTFC